MWFARKFVLSLFLSISGAFKFEGVTSGDAAASVAKKAFAYVEELAVKVAEHAYNMTADEQAALDTIKEFIDKLLSDMVIQREEDQNELYTFRNLIQGCNNEVINGKTKAALLKAKMDGECWEHRVCRWEQVHILNLTNTFCGDWDRMRTDPAHNTMPASFPDKLSHDYVKTTVQSEQEQMESCLENTEAKITPLYNAFTLCNESQTNLTKKNQTCGDYPGHQYRCEISTCAFADKMDQICGSLDTCRSSTVPARNTRYSEVEISEAARVADCQTGHTIKCLFAVFDEKNNSLKPLNLSKCENVTVDCGSLIYPPVPTPENCSTVDKPCSSEWLDAEYHAYNWTDNISPAICTACPSSYCPGTRCIGGTEKGNTPWAQPGRRRNLMRALTLDVDTSGCSYPPSETPVYVSSLVGNGHHADERGASEIYTPDYNTFRVHIARKDTNSPHLSAVNSAENAWHVNYIAKSEGPRKYDDGSIICAGKRTGWVDGSVGGINFLRLDADTSDCGFTELPIYITSLTGTGNHWVTTGSSEVYTPTSTSFWTAISTTVSVSDAESYTWAVNFIAQTPGKITDPTGSSCAGRSDLDWKQYPGNPDIIMIDVDISSCGYAEVPNLVTSLTGDHFMACTTGSTEIYDLTNTSFRIHIVSAGCNEFKPTVANAISWKWHVNWIASSHETDGSHFCV